jgi:hypothetical protein
VGDEEEEQAEVRVGHGRNEKDRQRCVHVLGSSFLPIQARMCIFARIRKK